MKVIIFTIILLLSMNSFSQSSFKLAVGVSSAPSIDILETDNMYIGTSMYAGPRIDTRSGNIGLYGMYQFSTNNGSNGFFHLQSHFLGGKLEYRILGNEKRVSPYIEITALTEAGTNYRDGYLSIDGWYPEEYPMLYIDTYPSYSVTYYSRFYHSTPFAGNIMLGVDIRLIEGLHLNLGLGYGLRVVKTKFKYWKGQQDLPKEEIHKLSTETNRFNMLEIKIGMSYAFPFKKKE